MYKVFFNNPTSPSELEAWLNKLHNQDGLVLIAVDDGHYVFTDTRHGNWCSLPETLKVSEAAKLAGMHINTIRSTIHSGKLIATKPTGSHWRIAKSDLLAFIEGE